MKSAIENAKAVPARERPFVRFFLSRAEGFELVVTDNPSADYPPHTHVSTVILLIIRAGSATLTTPAGVRTLRKNKAAVIPPHALHALATDGDAEALALCLDRAFFSPRLRPDRTAALARFLVAAVAESLVAPKEKNALLKIACETELRAADADGGDSGGASLARLRRELETSPEEEKSLPDKGHLVRTFKKRYGLTPAGFLRQSRLRKARRELPCARSLTAAALNAGFFDQSHFIRHFKKLYRMTPGQYLASVQHVKTL